MNFEIERLKTFKNNWTCDKVDYEYLARIGMINVGDHITQCVFCKKLYQWTKYSEKIHGTAAQQHYKSNPRCPFFLYNKLNVSRRKKTFPVHTRYAQTENRLLSLYHWPCQNSHDVVDMADKGIFYISAFKLLICFYCGILVDESSKIDITPLNIHNESPCKFLKEKLKKGINTCLKNKEITCSICLTERPNIVTFPCRHCCCCNECFGKLRKTQCIVCRSKILNFIKIFYA